MRGRRSQKVLLTIASDHGRISGRLAVAAVTRQDVERFMHAAVAGTKPPDRAPRRVRGAAVEENQSNQNRRSNPHALATPSCGKVPPFPPHWQHVRTICQLSPG